MTDDDTTELNRARAKLADVEAKAETAQGDAQVYYTQLVVLWKRYIERLQNDV
jgi:outer membrane protein TolC